MGNSGKRRAISEFIQTGKFEFDEGLEGAEAPAERGPLDAAWLAEIQAQRQRLKASPQSELEIYRDFYKNPDLTEAQVDSLLEAMEKAVGEPERFYDEIEDAVSREGVMEDIGHGLGCVVNIPRFFPTRRPSEDQQKAVAKLKADFNVPESVSINPREHHFELCDPGWWHLWKAHTIAMKKWPEGLAPFAMHGAGKPFVYDDPSQSTKVALMADFGVGYYHSHAIAAQLAHLRYPHVFHLGDVYYGGTPKEFDDYYTSLLEPVMQHSLLWSMPENHELYSGGFAYKKFLADHQGAGPGKILQEGSYFAVLFAQHQIVGIDVNWHGRQRYLKAELRDWLDSVIEAGEKAGRTTILLSGSAPFVYGEDHATELYGDLKRWTDRGRIAMWFWGDNHYCALFERDNSKGSFIGSCIGHGGYPGDLQRDKKKNFVIPQWVETEPRFPKGYGLRDDVGNNGWVELTLLDGGGVELLYVDWLGCKRHRARYKLDTSRGGRLLDLDGLPERFTERVHAFP